jgi:D-alanine-D-alanine ligase
MSDKIRVGVLFGGRSCEHEVSVSSARSVLEAIDHQRYEVTMIGISKQGNWLMADNAPRLLEAGTVEDGAAGHQLASLDHGGGRCLLVQGAASMELDVIFPILHGPYGEDGTIQGLLELADIAYVGSGVLGSAVGMDKEMMKKVFRAEGLPQVAYRAVARRDWRDDPAAVQRHIETELGYPLFFKPANLGSSVGVAKARSADEFKAAMAEAAAYDTKIIVEAEADQCREIECAVLGNHRPEASLPGEVVPANEFYDYDAKYVDDNSRLVIPAPISPATTRKVQEMAIAAFKAVGALGLSRVDFFVRHSDEAIFLNEINTLPGFTPASMYPKLWEASGVGYSELIDRLIQLALERRQEARDVRQVL